MLKAVQGILLVAIILVCSCHGGVRKPIITGMENKVIPSFNILLGDSITSFNTMNLADDRKTVLFYYLPTCPHCRAQMREMLNHIKRYKNDQILIVTDADFKSMLEFNNYFQLQNYPNIISGVDTGLAVAKNYHVGTVPFTAVFNKNKRLSSTYWGRIRGNILYNITSEK